MRIKFPARLLLVWLAILLGLSLFASKAQAQATSPILLTAHAGFDGYCKSERWIPVRIIVENTGANAQVQVQVSHSNQGIGRTIYSLDLALPAGARKEFFLYAFQTPYMQTLTTSVIENKKVLVEHNSVITCLKQGDLLVGLLSDAPANYASLNTLKSLTGTAHIVPLSISKLPDQAQGWQALDALVVADVDSGALSAEQRAALGLWLAEGGKLLVMGGANWQPAAAGLTEFLPLTPTSTQKVESLSALKTYFHLLAPPAGGATLSTGALYKDAQTLIEQDGLPLLSRRAIGSGEVYYFAADPAAQPFKNWNGLEFFYNHLLSVKIAPPLWAAPSWNSVFVDSALNALPGLNMPSFLLVCGWLGLYLIFIGPLNYIVLRRLKRPELAWLTIPALVIAFTAVAYAAGFLYRGTRPTLNRLLIAQGWDTAPHMRADALMGIYSPSRTRYTLESEAPFRFLPRGSEASLQTGENWLILEQDASQQLPDARLEIGGLKSVVLQGNLPALAITHDLTVTISNQTPMLTGKITNNSDLTLKDAFLVTPGDIIELQSLKPGESRPVTIPLLVDRNNPGLYSMASPKFPGYYGSFNPNLTQDLSDERRTSLLGAAAAPQGYYNFVPSNWGIYLMGWVETPLLPTSIEKVNAKTVDTSLVIYMLTPTFQFKGNSWQLNSAVFAWESSVPEATPYSSSNNQIGQGYTLRFRPAVPLRYSRVIALTIAFDSTLTTSDNVLQLWDYREGAWVMIDPFKSSAGYSKFSISEPERFVGPGGEVLLSLRTADNSGWEEVYESSINLVVEP